MGPVSGSVLGACAAAGLLFFAPAWTSRCAAGEPVSELCWRPGRPHRFRRHRLREPPRVRAAAVPPGRCASERRLDITDAIQILGFVLRGVPGSAV